MKKPVFLPHGCPPAPLVCAIAVALLAGTSTSTPGEKAPLRAVPPSLVSSVYADGLESPDGIALHPTSGAMYVSEEDSARISLISKGQRKTVVDVHTPLYQGNKLSGEPLRFPEGIAFSPDGALLVVEDVPGGRLLRFAFDEEGLCPSGMEVPLPSSRHSFAWESIDINASGEMLLAGSDAEAVVEGRKAGPFYGVVLYRDSDGAWWRIHQRAFASYSSVRFSTDNEWAVYACEVSGEVGWINLRSSENLVGVSSHRVRTPEGLCMLPGGKILVVEEGGSFIELDVNADSRTVIAQGLGALESLCWDRNSGVAYFTADQAGEVRSFRLAEARKGGTSFFAPSMVEPVRTPPTIPPRCPSFLRGVLQNQVLEGVYAADVDREPFKAIASRIPLIALDAHAVPVGETEHIRDPIKHIQFVVFNPNVVKEEDVLPITAFVAMRESGRRIQSISCPMAMIGRRGMKRGATKPRKINVFAPHAGAVTVSNDGVTSVELLGLGKTPDFHIVIDPAGELESYMLVSYRNGVHQKYRLNASTDEAGIMNLVISYTRKLADAWVKLAAD